MADPLHGTPAVSGVGGFAQRTPERRPLTAIRRDAGHAPQQDQVSVAAAATVARRVLRERVLTRTRTRLELTDEHPAQEFAEVIDLELPAAFLGRLLSAQNQIAALRAGQWPVPRIRAALDQALREGAQEAIELLAADPQHTEGVVVVAEVIAEYARRLAALAGELGR